MPRSAMLPESTAQQILNMIETQHRFTVGDKLPNENDLAAELGVVVPPCGRPFEF